MYLRTDRLELVLVIDSLAAGRAWSGDQVVRMNHRRLCFAKQFILIGRGKL
jgi:hypothetical protein